METIAALGFSVDSSQAVAGARALDQLTAAADRAGRGADKLGQVIESGPWAGMRKLEPASKAAADGLQKATAALGAMENKAAGAGRSLEQAAQGQDRASKLFSAAAARQSAEMERLGRQADRLVASADPEYRMALKRAQVSELVSRGVLHEADALFVLARAEQQATIAAERQAAAEARRGAQLQRSSIQQQELTVQALKARAGVSGGPGVAGSFAQGLIGGVGFGIAVAGLHAITAAISGVVAEAERFQTLDAGLKRITTSTESAERVYGQLFEQSQRFGTSLPANIELFTQLARGAAQVGISAEQTVPALAGINRAVAQSGVSAESAQRGLYQLSQAFSKGKLDGDEYVSVAEQLPGVIDLLRAEAERTGTSLERLRATTGITTAFMIKAFQDANSGIIGQTNEIPETMDRAMQRVRNIVSDASREIERAGAFEPISKAINEIANSLQSGGIHDGARRLGEALHTAFDFLIANADIIKGVLKGGPIGGVVGFASRPGPTAQEITELQGEVTDLEARARIARAERADFAVEGIEKRIDLLQRRIAALRQQSEEEALVSVSPVPKIGDAQKVAPKPAKPYDAEAEREVERYNKALAAARAKAEPENRATRLAALRLDYPKANESQIIELDRVNQASKAAAESRTKLAEASRKGEADAKRDAETLADLERQLRKIGETPQGKIKAAGDQAVLRLSESSQASPDKVRQARELGEAMEYERQFAEADADAQRVLNEEREWALSLINKTISPQQELAETSERLNNLWRIGGSTLEQRNASMEGAAEKAQKLIDQENAQEEQRRRQVVETRRETDPRFSVGYDLAEDAAHKMDVVRNSGAAIASGFDDANSAATDFFTGVASGAEALNSVLANLEKRLISIALDTFVFGPLQAGVASLFSGAGAQAGIGATGTTTAPAAGRFGLDFTVGQEPPRFAGGGSFQAGGHGGTDQTLVEMRVTRGERVTVTPPGYAGNGANSPFIQILDQRGANAPAIEQKRTSGPGGQQGIRLILRDAQQQNITDGSMDKANRVRYGTTPRLY